MNCNFFCKHCGSSAGKQTFNNELNTAEILKTFKDLSRDFNPKEIVIAVTGGEPLLRKDIFEVMKFANNLGFQWGMVTNGYFVNIEVVNKMKESGMNSIDVSIDGIEEVHDELRNMKGSYEKAINAVKLLRENNFLQFLRITTTINKQNFFQLQEMYEAFSILGITGWRILTIEPIGRAEQNRELLLNKEELTHVLNFIKEKKKITKIDITYGCNTYLGLDFESVVRKPFYYCSAGINIASILYNGDISVCPTVERKKEFIQGNIKSDNFFEVWNNKFQIYRNKNRTSNEKCQKCEHWDNCLGGNFHSWDFEEKNQKSCHFN
ncbi:MAG: radical SAM protein [Candidatus Gracilibacteria bacterium]|nr:radical SAM protein [Candidatus Gracilibacteria bacterium]MDD2908541.1 radical SAM protein [Candidatus Gracilibacteria bacterium]